MSATSTDGLAPRDRRAGDGLPTLQDGEATSDRVASRRIADALRQAILAGTLTPGSRIRQESVAAQYGASRLPVREALRMLAAEGLVTLIANTGAWVSQLSLAECEEVYRLRERIEPLLLRYSMPGLTPAVHEQLADLAVRMRTADLGDFLQLDRQFHLLSFSAAHTAVLGDLVHRLWNTTAHYRRAYTQLLDAASTELLHGEHFTLVYAITTGDSTGAERILRQHIRRTRRRLAAHPEVFGA